MRPDEKESLTMTPAFLMDTLILMDSEDHFKGG